MGSTVDMELQPLLVLGLLSSSSPSTVAVYKVYGFGTNGLHLVVSLFNRKHDTNASSSDSGGRTW